MYYPDIQVTIKTMCRDYYYSINISNKDKAKDIAKHLFELEFGSTTTIVDIT
jgi:hypothetical protein